VAGAKAQTISATTYPFTSTTGISLADLSTGATQIIAADGDDPVSAIQPIGFDFWFNGVRQTQFSVNGNGLLRFGSTAITGEANNAMASTTNVPKIAAYWDDLRVGTDGGVFYKLTGTAPNRVLVVEWRNVCIPKPATSSLGNATFQCWISESTGKIEFVYGSGIVVATGYNYSIGFGTSATQFASVTSIATSCAYGTANDTQTDTIASGTQYTFTPLVPASPTLLTFSSVSISGMTLNWVDNATDEVGYAIYQSTDGINYAYLAQTAANAVSYAVSGLTPGTLYYYKVYAVTEGGMSTPLSGSQSTTACSMSGIYTVGPTGTYATIATAFAALQANGVSGPVALEIQITYTGETYPITLGAVPCASAANSIVIRPQGTLTITGSAAPVFTLDGVQYLTIDGRVGSTGTTKALTISNITTNSADIRIANGASYDTIKYCTLMNVNATTNTGAIFFSTSTGATGNNNNTIDFCDFVEGSTTYVHGIYSSGTAGKENSNNTISNCNFANYFNAGVATAGINIAINSSGWVINNNRFYQTAARTYTTSNTHRAIYIGTGNAHSINNNVIGYSSSAGTGTYAMAGGVITTFRGIELSVGSTTPSSVQGNTITNMSLSSTSGTITGIYVAAGSANVGNLTANTIGATTGTGAITATNTVSTSPAIIGINTAASTPAVVNIQNNNIGGLTVTGTATVGMGITGILATSSGTVTISGNTIGSTVTANSINSGFTTTSAAAVQVYGINSSLSTTATITNNTIANLNLASTSNLGFVAGIIQASSGTSTISGNTIRNLSGSVTSTQLSGQTGINGIAYTGTGTAVISQNTISAISNTNTGAIQSNVSGIGLTSSANSSILRNKIFDLRNASTMATATTPPTAIGILIANPSGTTTTVANNMISLGNGQTTNTEFMGIMNSTTSASALKVYYNTINIEGAAASGALPTMGFNRGNNTTTAITTAVDLKNNIIRNARTGGTGKHYAIVNGILVATGSSTGWGANASNFNILNANATTVSYWSGDQTLAGWRTASAGDGNSYNSVAVTFVNTATGNLHLDMGTTPNYIESHGTTVAVVNDYDNDSRPGPAGSINGGGILPDLGADEFDGVSIDDVAPAITYTALSLSCTTSDRTLTATIIDQSGVPLAGSGNEPRIYYKKGLSGTWYSRPGILSSGTVTNGTWSFPITGADMGGISPADRVYYYVTAQDVAGTPNIGANPGTGFAATNVNSVTATPTTPNNYFVSYPSGTFNVGTGQPFATITEAVASYNTNTCLTGPVTFLLTDATYSTGETYPIVINNNPLANATATLTIKPATGVAAAITSASGTAAVFKLLNAQHVTIDGVNAGGSSLTLNNGNAGSNTAIVWLASTATTGPGNKNISLLNMNMVGGIATSTSNWGIIAGVDGASPAATNGMDNDSVTIQGNTIKKCGYALMLMGTNATTAGGLNGWVIKNNILGPSAYSATENLGVNGVFMRNMANVVYSGNTLQNVGFTTTTNGIAGIYMEAGIDGIVIDSNIVDSVLTAATSAPSVWAYYLGSNVKNATISRNKISSVYSMGTSGGARAITVTNATAAGNVNIVNNFISDVVSYSSTTNTNWPVGISVEGTSGGVNIYHNSINLFGSRPGPATATGSTDIFISATGGNIDVRNNLLVNSYENTSSTTDKAYTIYSTAANTVFSNIDYNNYYPTGGTPILGNIGGTDRTTLANMVAGFGGNTHSVNGAASFVSSSDLHIAAGSASVVESAAAPITGLVTDIDGQVRPGPAGSTYGGGTIPDIGADEFDGVPTDGTGPLISYAAFGSSTCITGDRTLTGVTISDFSGVPTTGSLMPRIYFKKNAGAWLSDTGTLASGTATSGTWNFTISAAAMGGLTAADVVSYYVIAQDIVPTPNISAFPGAGIVATDVNTVTTPPTTPNTFSILPTLSGSYTVGAGGNYPTLTAAINAYNIACLAGNVTFSLTDASYSTGETFPIVIRNNANAGPSATLTIKPATGVATAITSASGTAAVFKLLNAQHVTIDGVNAGGSSLTLNNGNTGSNTAIVWLASTATTGPGNKNISLLNMNMVGGIATSTTNWGIIAGVDGASPAATNGMDNDSVTIQGNTIKKCGYALMLMGTNATTAGGLNGWVIKNNILGPAAYSATENLGVNGVFMRNMANVVYSGNTLQNVGFTTTTNGIAGMYMEAGIDGIVIDSNIVDSVLTAATSAPSVWAYYLGSNVKNATISRNKISSVYSMGTSGGARAISVTNATAAGNVNIVNNFISDVVSYSSTTNTNWPIGISVEGTSGGVNIYHNSINLFGSRPGPATATGSTDIFISATGGNIDVRNNLLVNSYENTSSITDKAYTIYSTAANTVFSNIDYNNYYPTGGTPILGNIGGTDRTTLTNMIAGFGGNTNSINSPALFMAPTDLHLQPFSTNVPLIAGMPIVAVTTDIDGVLRSATTPVIGANEVNIPPCSGAPTAGIVTASTLSSCGTFNPNLTLAGSSPGAGITLQWQSSPDSSAWTDISGATNLTYTPSVSTTTYYRALVTCATSSLSDSTPGVHLVSHPYPAITGPAVTCVGGIITLSAAPGGGTWASGATPTATIDATTGEATGIAMGTAPITYTSSAGCASYRAIAVVSAPSAPMVTPGSSVICDGGSVPFTAASAYSGTAAVSSGAISVAVPDNSVVGVATALPVSLPPGATITSVSVTLNATMTYMGDWGVNLTAPNGNTLNLFNRHGLGGDNFSNTVVSSAGTTTFASGTPPYTGTYAATAATGSIGITGYPVNVTTWAGLYSVPSGTWTLSLRDFAVALAGTLTSWGLTINYTIPSDITWSPTSTLYTDAGLTTPYAGTATAAIYAAPPAAGSVSATNTYTATAAVPGCSVSTTGTATVTTNPLPAVIGGTPTVCVGFTRTLTNSDAVGSWSSSNTAVGTIDAATGVVAGIAPGTTAISYTFTGSGCSRIQVVTVNAAPGAITGVASACETASVTLSNGDAGGTWSSGSSSVATVGSVSGTVTGVAAGLANISYILPNGCFSTKEFTVNPVPVNTVTPTSALFCLGDSITLIGSSSLPEFSILSQNFNTGLGGWAIIDSFGDAASFWHITTAPTSGATGDGTPMLSATPFDYAGITHTILISPSFSTIGYSSAILAFNQNLLSMSSSDALVDVQYSIDGGTTWDSLISQVDSTSGGGTWSASAPQVAIGLPAAALGQGNVKLRWNYYSNFGVWWDIDNIVVKVTQPAPTNAWSGVGGASGLSCASCDTVVVTPAASGANVYQFTATTASSCATNTNVTVNVNPLPATIGGTLTVCLGLTTSLTNTDAGGTWASSNPAIASVGSASGIVNANAVGNAVITYTLPTGCITTATITVNPLPAAIGGTMQTCVGHTTTLANTDASGTWASNNTSIATIDPATGIMAGVLDGTTTITYTLPTTCIATTVVTINPLPATIGGTLQVCHGLTTTLTNTSIGGTWSSADDAIATIGSSSGVAAGVLPGNVNIAYTLPTGCATSSVLTVNPLPAAIAGGSMEVCEGLTITLSDADGGGSWASGNTSIAAIDPATGVLTGILSGTSTITYSLPTTCIATAIVTVNPLPDAIGGTLQVCHGLTTTLTDASTGGTWVSSNDAIATIGSSTGIVTGVVPGNVNITYTLPTGCIETDILTVNPLPAAISGSMEVCQGLTATLSNTDAGGTWASGNPSVATIGSASGIATGILAGTAAMAYTLPTGCIATAILTVNPLPAAIGGTLQVCEGLTTTLTHTIAGGTWSSGSTTTASIGSSSGIATGLVAGSASITYTLPTGCIISSVLTVNQLPTAITGTMEICENATTTLSSTPTGGAWSTASTGVATVGLISGIVTGVAAGTATITYTLLTSCMATTVVTIDALPTVYSVTATSGGAYCAGDAGVNITLTGSGAGISYQLYNGPTATGAPIAGTGSSLDFGVHTAGAYSIVATNAITSCTKLMGSITVTMNPLPIIYNVTGGGSYCAGGTGVTIGLSNSQLGKKYQLYFGSTVSGAPVAGTGSAISFGLQAGVGTYTVLATDTTTTCFEEMSGSAVISTNPVLVPSITVSASATTVCAGTSVTFSSSIVNGGTLPAYIWRVNGLAVTGATSSSYTYVPANGDVVTGKLISNATCVMPDTAVHSVAMAVTPAYLPLVNITVSPGIMVQPGTNVTMAATVTGGGASPEYQWYIGSSAIAGATNATFTYNLYADGDSVSCVVKGTGTCGLSSFNSAIMHVGVTAINTTSSITDIRLMPNPNKGEFAVKGTLSVKADKEVSIEITNMLGQVVYKGMAIARNGVVDTRVKLSDTLANGMYMLNLIYGEERKVFHFVLGQ
jgi:subtilisin-like proprotein convertase family protein